MESELVLVDREALRAELLRVFGAQTAEALLRVLDKVAALLRQAGYRAIPVVAGEQTTLGAEAEARLHNVAVLQDGRSSLWEEALAAWGKEIERP